MVIFIKTRTLAIAAIFLLLPGVFTSAQDYSVRIAFIGNSITYGAGLSNPASQSYPGQLGDLLQETYGDTCVIGNFAISSRTMLKNGDFPIWNDPEFNQALAFKPNIVVIALGTNDTKPQNWDEFGGEFYGDYKSMIDTFKQSNPYAEIFLCHPPPAFDIMWGIRDSVIVSEVIPVVDQLVSETGSFLIDFYTPLVDSVHLFPDNIHPNVEGSAVMAAIVNERFTETDIIRQAERGLSFITKLQSDRKYITDQEITGLLSWTTINATTVYLDGTAVDLNGSQEVDHRQGTSHILIAKGEKNSDTLAYEFILYTPDVNKIALDKSQETIYTGDTVEISASYFDQHGYMMEDAVVDLEWSLSIGKGDLFGQTDNKILFTRQDAGITVINARHMEVKGAVSLKIEERDHTSAASNIAGKGHEVYPNPFHDHLVLRLNKTKSREAILKIIDIQGKTRIQRILHLPATGLYYLDTSQLPEGLYLYELSWMDGSQGGKQVYTGKLVKNQRN